MYLLSGSRYDRILFVQGSPKLDTPLQLCWRGSLLWTFWPHSNYYSPSESHGFVVSKWAAWSVTLSSSPLGTASFPQTTRRLRDLEGLRTSLTCENWGEEGIESSAFCYHLSLALLPHCAVAPFLLCLPFAHGVLTEICLPACLLPC